MTLGCRLDRDRDPRIDHEVAKVLYNITHNNCLDIDTFSRKGLVQFVINAVGRGEFADPLVAMVGEFYVNYRDCCRVLPVRLTDVVTHLEPSSPIVPVCAFAATQYFLCFPEAVHEEVTQIIIQFIFECEGMHDFLGKKHLILLFCAIMRNYPRGSIDEEFIDCGIALLQDGIDLGFDPHLTPECQYPVIALREVVQVGDQDAQSGRRAEIDEIAVAIRDRVLEAIAAKETDPEGANIEPLIAYYRQLEAAEQLIW
jgi:hypothetical protein